MHNCTNFCAHNISKIICSAMKYEFRFAIVVLNFIIPFKWLLTNRNFSEGGPFELHEVHADGGGGRAPTVLIGLETSGYETNV